MINKYGLLISNLFKNEQNNNLIINTNDDSIKKYNLILITSNFEANIKNNFELNSICLTDVQIKIQNLSKSNEFDLIAIAKNPRYLIILFKNNFII